jgi:hypothetical protein
MDISTRARTTKRGMCLMSDLPLIACDANETLVDLEATAQTFGRFASVVLELDAASIAMGKQSRKGKEV